MSLPAADAAHYFLGQIAPGMLADIVVLSRDLLTCPPKEILKAEVEMTIVGGRVVFTR